MREELIRTPSWCEIRGMPALARALDKRYSYFQKGYFFSPQYKARRWDGKVHLLKLDDEGNARFPAGLWDEVVQFAQEKNYTPAIVDRRVRPAPAPALKDWRFSGELRWFQAEGEKIASKVSGGVFYLAPRAGKTLLASKIISNFAEKTLFVVPSKLLYDQGLKVMRERFPTAKVTGFSGESKDLSGDLVVAVMASVAAHLEAINQHNWGVLFVDEVHHCTSDGEKWKESVLLVNANRKFGLTGTLELPESGGTAENGTIWVAGICGPILLKRTQSDLVGDGALMASRVTFLRHEAEALTDNAIWELAVRQHDDRAEERTKKWEAACRRAKMLRRRAPKQPSDEADKTAFQVALYDLGIGGNEARNKRIVDAAVERVDKGLLVLVDAQRVEHVTVLYDALCERLPKDQVAALTAKFCKGPFKKKEVVAALNDGRLRVVVGNLLGEGVDIPNLNVVINAEGGQGFNSVFQRMRHMNAVEGKEEAELVDLIDHHHEQLATWTKRRIQHYQKEAALTLSIEKRAKV